MENLPENTLPETNIAPENRPLEKEIPFGAMLVSGSVYKFKHMDLVWASAWKWVNGPAARSPKPLAAHELWLAPRAVPE